MSRFAKTIATAAAAGALAVTAAPAAAGGLARTSALSARSNGLGGAFTAIADDPSAVHHNPAGLSFIAGNMALVNLEVASATREYSPEFADDTCAGDNAGAEFCRVQRTKRNVSPAPTLGIVFRPDVDGAPSRLTLGMAAYTYFGGLAIFGGFEDTSIPALEKTTTFAVEIAPGFSYEVNDHLSIGATLRVNLGFIDLRTRAKPIDAELDGSGVGLGGNLGLRLRPNEHWSIGVVYRSGVSIDVSGEGTFDAGTGARDADYDFNQQWPQSAGLGVAYRASDEFLVSAQFDWFDWSRLNSFQFEFPGGELPTQTVLLDWTDNVIVRLGAEWWVSDRVAVRAGAGFDSQTFPEHTTERSFVDTDAFFGAAGLSVRLAEGWTLDASFDYLGGPALDIDDNRDEFDGFRYQPPGSISPRTPANAAPGQHQGSIANASVGLRVTL